MLPSLAAFLPARYILSVLCSILLRQLPFFCMGTDPRSRKIDTSVGHLRLSLCPLCRWNSILSPLATATPRQQHGQKGNVAIPRQRKLRTLWYSILALLFLHRLISLYDESRPRTKPKCRLVQTDPACGVQNSHVSRCCNSPCWKRTQGGKDG